MAQVHLVEVLHLDQAFLVRRALHLMKLITLQSRYGPLESFQDDLVSQQTIEFGAHTRPEVAFLLSVVRPGDHVFDLGAHIGSFTVPLASRVGEEGRVLALEPVPAHVEVLLRNLRGNNLSNVVIEEALLAPTGARYEAQVVQGNTGATYFREHSEGGFGACRSIDDLVSAYFSPRVIKIDIEGLEYWALSASRYVERSRPILYSEVSANQLSRFGAAISDVDRLLRYLNYRMFRNVGARNASHDDFEPIELQSLEEGGVFFDVLALPREDSRIADIAVGLANK